MHLERLNWQCVAQFFPSWEKDPPAENICSVAASSMKQKESVSTGEAWDHSGQSGAGWVGAFVEVCGALQIV